MRVVNSMTVANWDINSMRVANSMRVGNYDGG